ncbi:MAG TPA: recombinase family protein [Micropepsaceae bacterium]
MGREKPPKGVNIASDFATQSFNTTTSMGRLTLNVLLSFAQFEREVTGERIRDKFAASKKKGMWMGGYPPLGYDIDSRKLVVNPPEAETVNLIFKRYLDLGCVKALHGDLAAKGVVSKRWTASTGVAHSGEPLGRGALYCLLKNRVYIGKTMHKGVSYPGEHQAIITQDLFDAVQARITGYRKREPGKARSSQDAMLTGILFDAEGTLMTPTYSRKPDGRRYRYYTSQSRLKGNHSNVSISRVPAAALEDLIKSALTRLQLSGSPDACQDDRSVLSRITIKSNSVTLEFDREAAVQKWRATNTEAQRATAQVLVDDCRERLASGEELTDGEHLILTLPVRARFRGGRASILDPAGAGSRPSLPDASLIKALARAHSWKRMLIEGEVGSVDALAVKLGQERRHVGRTLNLAFLSPALTRSILSGEQSPNVRLARLLDAVIPLSWRAQQSFLGP